MSDVDLRDKRDLNEFANASDQLNRPTPVGYALQRQTAGVPERVFTGAQRVAVPRDEVKIRQRLTVAAAYAGEDWFYRFPVRKAGGGQDYIEGPTIKLANEVARIYGNNSIEIRELDVGDAWVFYARFADIESGFSMERAFRQRKSQTSMKTKDADRQLDIAYQIGQSKAIRNVIVNSLQSFCDHAFDHARDSLIQKIGRELEKWRERTIHGIGNIPVDLVRVERLIGRPAREWTAPNISSVIAMMRSISDGMASVDDVFPPLPDAKAATAAAPSPATNTGDTTGEPQQGGMPFGGQSN
jgi:hypothetical protein